MVMSTGKVEVKLKNLIINGDVYRPGRSKAENVKVTENIFFSTGCFKTRVQICKAKNLIINGDVYRPSRKFSDDCGDITTIHPC